MDNQERKLEELLALASKKKKKNFALEQLCKAIVVMCPGYPEMGCIMPLLSEVLGKFRALHKGLFFYF